MQQERRGKPESKKKSINGVDFLFFSSLVSDWAIDLVLILNDVSYSWVIGNAALVTAWPSDSNRISDKRSFEYAPILIAVNWILRGCSSSSVTGGGEARAISGAPAEGAAVIIG